MQRISYLILIVLALLAPRGTSADPLVIDFEGLNDLDPVTTQFLGLVFSNATVLTSGIFGGSLNEIENPPHSGINVVTDEAGPISISFLTPLLSFGGFFTYTVSLKLEAFDVANHPLLPLATSAFNNNQAISGENGSVPNEFLELTFAQGIAKLMITGDPLGDSFTLDDVTVTSSVPVPEPGTLSLLLAGGITVLCARKRFFG